MREDWTEPLTPAEKAQLEAIEEQIKNAPAEAMQAAREATLDVLVKAEEWVKAKDLALSPQGHKEVTALNDLYNAVQLFIGMKLYANEENKGDKDR